MGTIGTQPVSNSQGFVLCKYYSDPLGGMILRCFILFPRAFPRGLPAVVDGVRVQFYWLPSLPLYRFSISLFMLPELQKTSVVLLNPVPGFAFRYN